MNKSAKTAACMVEGCLADYAVEVGESPLPVYRLCQEHFNAWGYFLAGVACDMPVRVDTARYDTTMEKFLDYCAREIAGFGAFAEVLKSPVKARAAGGYRPLYSQKTHLTLKK